MSKEIELDFQKEFNEEDKLQSEDKLFLYENLQEVSLLFEKGEEKQVQTHGSFLLSYLSYLELPGKHYLNREFA